MVRYRRLKNHYVDRARQVEQVIRVVAAEVL